MDSENASIGCYAGRARSAETLATIIVICLDVLIEAGSVGADFIVNDISNMHFRKVANGYGIDGIEATEPRPMRPYKPKSRGCCACAASDMARDIIRQIMTAAWVSESIPVRELRELWQTMPFWDHSPAHTDCVVRAVENLRAHYLPSI